MIKYNNKVIITIIAFIKNLARKFINNYIHDIKIYFLLIFKILIYYNFYQ